VSERLSLSELRGMSVKIPDAWRREAQRIADRRYISLSDMFREALREKIERERADGKRAR
jgi:metal-responsive CopG/Arc/MetJ family transcriptional regulator